MRLFEADQVGKKEGNLSLVDFFFLIDGMTSFSNKKERFSLARICGWNKLRVSARDKPPSHLNNESDASEISANFSATLQTWPLFRINPTCLSHEMFISVRSPL